MATTNTSQENPQQPLEIDTTVSASAVFDDAVAATPNAALAVPTKNPSSAGFMMRTPSGGVRGDHGSSKAPTTVTPGGMSAVANSPTATRGAGLTVYERSMLQKEERERKMRALQDKLMADFTFTPKSAVTVAFAFSSSNNSTTPSPLRPASPSSLGTSSIASVFSRLYAADTAASRGHRRSFAGGAQSSAPSTPARRGPSAGGGGGRSASRPSSPRLEELYKAGEEKLRSRDLSDQEEADALRRRLEERDLQSGGYTFRPCTKWDLAAERRRMAREAVEREADEEARRATPKIVKAERAQQRRLIEELELEECTFQPKTRWDIAEERRQKALQSPTPPKLDSVEIFSPATKSERERMDRQRRYEDSQLKECTFKPKTNWSVKEINCGKPDDAAEIEIIFGDDDDDYDDGGKRESLRSLPAPALAATESAERGILNLSGSVIKLVSQDSFQEEKGKKVDPPEMFRRDMVRQIVTPRSPEWKQKYRKIGQKAEKEAELAAQGHGTSDTRVRGLSVLAPPDVCALTSTSTRSMGPMKSPQRLVGEAAQITPPQHAVESGKPLSSTAGSDEPPRNETMNFGKFNAALLESSPTEIADVNGFQVATIQIDDETTAFNTEESPHAGSEETRRATSEEPVEATSVVRKNDHVSSEQSTANKDIALSNVKSSASDQLIKDKDAAASESKRAAENEAMSKKKPKAKKWYERLSLKKAQEDAPPYADGTAMEESAAQDERKAKELADEEAKMAEDAARLVAEVRIAKDMKLTDDACEAEAEKLAQEARMADDKKLAQVVEARAAENARMVEETRLAEEVRVEQFRLATEARVRDEARVAEEERVAIQERLEKEEILAEKVRVAEQERVAEEARAAEVETLAEEERLAEEVLVAHEERIAKEARAAEELRLKEEARVAEEALAAQELTVTEKARVAKEEMLAKEALVDEKACIADATCVAEEARISDDEGRHEVVGLAKQARVEEKEQIPEAQRKAAESSGIAQEALLVEISGAAVQTTAGGAKDAEDARIENGETLRDQTLMLADVIMRADEQATGSEYDTDAKSISSNDSLADALDEDVNASEGDKPKKKMKSDRAKKWKDRLKKKSKKSAERSESDA